MFRFTVYLKLLIANIGDTSVNEDTSSIEVTFYFVRYYNIIVTIVQMCFIIYLFLILMYKLITILIT